MLRLVVTREIPDDESLFARWDALVDQMERPQVFYTAEWAWAVARAYAGSVSPFLCLAYHDDELVGIASMAQWRDQPGLSFLAGTTADYCDFVSRPQDRGALIDAVLEALFREAVSTL